MKPYRNNLYIKPLPDKDRIGRIFIPEASRDRSSEGVIVAIGDDVDTDPQINIGNMIMFKKYMGTKVKIKDEEYLIINQNDVLALVG